ncbi:hypothetical protein VitviT2T_023716 [Vitis vinifera]|uniref:LOB domain-containing protein n=2 Tax=Vitis vinifera TaxID=29760 RepID=A0ABY9DG42_VITVI|nr:hypothetical protein VitviT2T_023716 [Vitis vinifera]
MTSKADELEGVPPGTYCVWKPKAAESPPGRCRKNNSTGSSKRWKFYDFLHWSNNDGKDTFVFLTPRSNMKKKAEKEAPSGVRKPKPKSIAAKTSTMAAQVPPRARTHQPCAACRMLRRRCDRDCILAPYFPSYEAEKFAGVHRVFGASNVIRMIQMVEESRREDAVKAIIYEATARLRDPVYGSAGAIFHLQKMIQDLKTQLDSIRTQTLVLQEQRDQLLGILKNVHHMDPVSPMDFPMFGAAGSLSNGDILRYDPSTFPLDCDWTW